MNLKRLLNIRFLVVFAIGYFLPVMAFVLVFSDRSPWSTEVLLRGVPEMNEKKVGPVVNPLWNDVDGIVAFTGDIMQHARQKGGDFDRSYSLVSEELGAADIVIGNLEFPVEPTRPIGPKHRTVIFNGEIGHVDALARLGFDGLSIANNHIFDCGVPGLKSTLALLEERNVSPVGLADPRQGRVSLLQPAIFDVNGIQVAVCGATYTINVPKDAYPPEFPVLSLPFHDWRDDYREFGRTVLTQSAMLARSAGAQVLFLFAHWGQEWSFSPMPSQMDAADDAFQSGFDMIIGNHTHVIGSVKKVREKFVVTSMGNFISDFREREVTIGAVTYVGVTSEGKISRLGLLPLFTVRDDGRSRPLHMVVPLNQRRKAELLRTLAGYGVRDADQRWHFSRILSSKVFEAYRLEEPPQRH